VIPAILILLQPDAGSAIIYAAFLFPLYREGISSLYLLLGVSVLGTFLFTLLFGPLYFCLLVAVVGLFFLFKRRRKYLAWLSTLAISGLFILSSFSVNYTFYNFFKQHHRDRINIVLGKKTDIKGIGYNTNQSEIAIGSGGWFGKGWTEGTQTKGGFVPEQHTDYIFCTIGEEWGFLGSFLVVCVFMGLIIRVIFVSERQKSQFNRMYGYGVAGILFIHFTINIGMVTGLLPTVGIPLPFFSYGGSGLWGFTMLLFILIKIDADRMHY